MPSLRAAARSASLEVAGGLNTCRPPGPGGGDPQVSHGSAAALYTRPGAGRRRPPLHTRPPPVPFRGEESTAASLLPTSELNSFSLRAHTFRSRTTLHPSPNAARLPPVFQGTRTTSAASRTTHKTNSSTGLVDDCPCSVPLGPSVTSLLCSLVNFRVNQRNLSAHLPSCPLRAR